LRSCFDAREASFLLVAMGFTYRDAGGERRFDCTAAVTGVQGSWH
jgi:hypothetical protein